jgi:O-glycosyl hydrolase
MPLTFMRSGWAGLALLGGLAFSTTTPTIGSEIDVKGELGVIVDGTQRFQRIDGFGVNANPASWNDGQLKPALDLLVDDFAMTIWRVIVEKADWEKINDNNDPQVFNWNYYHTLYKTPRFRDLWSTVEYLNRKRVEVLLNVMGIVPQWMGGTIIKQEAEDEWVEMIASLVYYGREVRKIQFKLLSPLNETDIGSPEGPSVGPAQYVRLLRKLVLRLESLGLSDLRMVAPDTASIEKANSAYLPAIMADAVVMAKIAHVGVHNYEGHSASIARAIKRSPYPDRSFWLTEWAAACPGCDNGKRNEDEWSFAKTSTLNLLNHLQDGATAALFYEGYDSFYQHHGSQSFWGLLAYEPTSKSYAPRKRLDTNSHVFKFILPGAIRVGASASNPSLSLVAFYHPTSRRLSIVGYNFANTRRDVRVRLKELSPIQAFEVYETTKSRSRQRERGARVTAGEAAIHVTPDSFFTITGLSQ